MAQYRLSEYAHLFHRNGKNMLYHSLKMGTVHIGDCEIDMEKRGIDLEPGSEMYGILSDGGFICSHEDDEKLLQKCRSEIQEPYISTAYFFLTKN